LTSAKLSIIASIEEVESLRNTRRLEYKQIENVGEVDNTDAPNVFNGFSTGFKQISISPGTDDDLSTAPGVDGKWGTSDDVINSSLARDGYSRQIAITNLPGGDSIKKVEVTFRYPASNGAIGEIRGVSYLNDEFRIAR
jgi:hypothetical protein